MAPTSIRQVLNEIAKKRTDAGEIKVLNILIQWNAYTSEITTRIPRLQKVIFVNATEETQSDTDNTDITSEAL